MTVEDARVWIVKFSLGASALTLVFCFAAPGLGYPIEWADAVRLAETFLPIFTGYLGSAAAFAFGGIRRSTQASRRLLGTLVATLIRWPPLVCWGVISVLFIAYATSNRIDVTAGSGMSVDQLAFGLSLSLSILTVATSSAVVWLFGTEPQSVPRQ